MPFFLFLLQIALPAVLLVWLAFAPARHLAVYALQVLSTAIVLLTIALVAPWAMPPWWVPYVYGFVLITLVACQAGRRNLKSPRSPLTQFTQISPLVGLALYGAFLSCQAVAGHFLPNGESINIKSPLSAGRFIVENGGSRIAVNGHLHTSDPSDPLHDTANGQSRALDIIPIDRFGLRSAGFWPSDPARYIGFGHPVVAPCDGTVITSMDGYPDQRVPHQDLAAPAGNHVVILCGDFHVVLAHLKMGSVTVQADDHVTTGTVVGELGNSGASTEPHLHIHAERPPAAPGNSTAEPLWLLVDGQFFARNDRFQN